MHHFLKSRSRRADTTTKWASPQVPQELESLATCFNQRYRGSQCHRILSFCASLAPVSELYNVNREAGEASSVLQTRDLPVTVNTTLDDGMHLFDSPIFAILFGRCHPATLQLLLPGQLRPCARTHRVAHQGAGNQGL